VRSAKHNQFESKLHSAHLITELNDVITQFSLKNSIFFVAVLLFCNLAIVGSRRPDPAADERTRAQKRTAVTAAVFAH